MTDPAISQIYREDRPTAFLWQGRAGSIPLSRGYGEGSCVVDAVERFEDRALPLRSNPHQLLQLPPEEEGEGREGGSAPPPSKFYER